MIGDTEGLHILNDLEKNDKYTIYELIKNTRAKNEPCFVCFPHEWEKRSNQIIAHIKSYNNTQLRVFYARKCEVKSISLKDIRSFCDQYHIQGSNRLGFVGWGLFFGDELLGVLSLGRHHRQNGDTLLDRLCFRDDVRVVGGASRLFAKAVTWAMEHGIAEVVSFSDNRWSPGRVYECLGFTFDRELPPDYFYVSVDDYRKAFSKQSQKKSNTDCPTDITEKQWAELHGLMRVYDAGKKRWKYKIQLRRKIKSMESRRQGYFNSVKGGIIYYQSSYELRAATLLDSNDNVVSYSTQIRFVSKGRERYIDFLVRWKDDSVSVIEIKPIRRIEKCSEQINDHKCYAEKQGWEFTIWTESELGFSGEHAATKWADAFLSTINGVDFVAERKRRSCDKTKKYYHNTVATDKVKVWCDYCQQTHEALRLTYERNIARNGEYICERKGGHIAGKKPKKKKENPYAVEGKKQCNRCKEIKLIEEFGSDKYKSDGLSTNCRKCRAEKSLKKYHESA